MLIGLQLNRNRSSTVGVLSDDEGFDYSSDLLLLASRKLGCSFEQLTHSTRRSGPSLLACGVSYQIFHGDTQSFSNTQQLVSSKRYRVALPVSIRALRDA